MSTTRIIACVHALLSVIWCACLMLDAGRPILHLLGNQASTFISMNLSLPIAWLVVESISGTSFSMVKQLEVHLVLAVVLILNSLCAAVLLHGLWRLLAYLATPGGPRRN